MSVELRLLDHFKLANRLVANFACGYSEDNRLFILCENGIYIIALKGNPAWSFSTFCCKKDFLEVSDFLPSDNIDLDINSFHKDLERIDLYEITMATEYSASLNHTIPIQPVPSKVQWSPRGIVGKTDCMLAVLTNLYSLEIYVKYLDENEILKYCLICNVSQAIIDMEKINWSDPSKFSVDLKLRELKKRIGVVTPTAFTWSHVFKVNHQETCTLCVGHMNGNITIWRINLRPANSKEQSKLHFLGKYCTHSTRITTMYWHQTTEFGGGLCFGDSDGKMSVLQVAKLDQEEVVLDNELTFWAEPDKVLVDKIMVMTYNKHTYIILVKRSYLIIYGICETGSVFDQKVCNVGHYYITGIHHFDNVILILTVPGILKQYTVSIEGDKIVIDEKIIALKIDIPRYRTHGFFISNNKVLLGIITYPCHLSSIRKAKAHINVFLFHNSLVNPLDILWCNNSGSLRDYWDCFEALRLICLKDKRFPWLGLPPDLNYDNLSILQLKTLRWLAKLSEMVFSSVLVIRSYNIKPYIILHYLVEIKLIVNRINRLLNLKNSGKHLSLFQLRSIDIQNFFLKEMVVKNILAKANVGKKFVNDIQHVMSIANELKYPPMLQCLWCGEKIIGPLCLPPHADSRCSITMMPIFLVPSYKCPFCKALAHKEVEREQDPIMCPYCDVPMETRTINGNVDNDFSKDYYMSCEEVRSVCFDDCLKEDIRFSDIEENTSDYVILSDSEDESSDGGKLRTLYVQMANMSVEDILRQEDEGSENGDANVDEPQPGPSTKVIKLMEDE